MKKTILKISAAGVVAMAVSGCSTATFETDKTVQSSIIAGYLDENGVAVKNAPCKAGDAGCTGIKKVEAVGKSRYEKERDNLMTKIAKTSPVPMRVPDTVLRVMLLPYVDDTGALTTPGYKFTKVDNGQWILGEYLVKEGESVKLLTPLGLNTITESEPQRKTNEAAAQDQIPQTPMMSGQMNPMANMQRGGDE